MMSNKVEAGIARIIKDTCCEDHWDGSIAEEAAVHIMAHLKEEGMMLPGQTEMPLTHDMQDELKTILARVKQWQGDTSDFRLGGGPFNTEGLRLLLATLAQMLEVLSERKISTQLPTKHHA